MTLQYKRHITVWIDYKLTIYFPQPHMRRILRSEYQWPVFKTLMKYERVEYRYSIFTYFFQTKEQTWYAGTCQNKVHWNAEIYEQSDGDRHVWEENVSGCNDSNIGLCNVRLFLAFKKKLFDQNINASEKMYSIVSVCFICFV